MGMENIIYNVWSNVTTGNSSKPKGLVPRIWRFRQKNVASVFVLNANESYLLTGSQKRRKEAPLHFHNFKLNNWSIPSRSFFAIACCSFFSVRVERKGQIAFERNVVWIFTHSHVHGITAILSKKSASKFAKWKRQCCCAKKEKSSHSSVCQSLTLPRYPYLTQFVRFMEVRVS